VTPDRDRVLSDFIDAWNAGRRPDVDEYLARVPEPERSDLADALMSFMTFAPTPQYSEETLAAIRSDALVAEALAAPGARGGLLPALLSRVRERESLTIAQVAEQLVAALGLKRAQEDKTAGYLERLERGELEPARVSGRVLDGLARVLGVGRGELEGAGSLSGWGPPLAASAGPMFRADDDAAAAVGEHLDVLADALSAPGGAARDEVDDLFLGGS